MDIHSAVFNKQLPKFDRMKIIDVHTIVNGISRNVKKGYVYLIKIHIQIYKVFVAIEALGTR